MTTQKNRDATVFLVSQNAVITRPVKSQPQPKNIKHQQAGRFVKKSHSTEGVNFPRRRRPRISVDICFTFYFKSSNGKFSRLIWPQNRFVSHLFNENKKKIDKISFNRFPSHVLMLKNKLSLCCPNRLAICRHRSRCCFFNFPTWEDTA